MTELRTFNDPRHVAVAFGTLANQQQVTALDGSTEIGDRRFVAALPAPHIRQQALAEISWNRFPAMTSWLGESGE